MMTEKGQEEKERENYIDQEYHMNFEFKKVNFSLLYIRILVSSLDEDFINNQFFINLFTCYLAISHYSLFTCSLLTSRKYFL